MNGDMGTKRVELRISQHARNRGKSSVYKDIFLRDCLAELHFSTYRLKVLTLQGFASLKTKKYIVLSLTYVASVTTQESLKNM